MREISARTLVFLLASGMLTLLGAQAQAAPLTLDLTGTVTSASGTWASQVGNSVGASLTIDLDAGNAIDSRSVNQPPDIPFSQWAFLNPPYSGSFSGALGSPAGLTITVKTHDNVDTDAFGNPFDLTGVWDALSVLVPNTTSDCPIGQEDPVWGCLDESAPELDGSSFEVFLVGASDWFTEGTLPSEIPSLGVLQGAYGVAQSWSGGILVASAEIEYTTLIPEPSTALLVGIGLLGLGVAGNPRP
ncbi:MAG: hypothetical protein NZ990_04380 [Myxococcota bacterium]|nr:hypothetical protein [Myxococcota bacterium]